MTLREQEGYIPVDGYRVWYRIVGGGGTHEQLPLLILHGGPGAPHDYLENLEALASDTRRVVFYDQLGCGRSDHPDDPALCYVARFADELETVRRALGLDRVHILGQSWGGMLAQEYALRQPQGLVSLILANTTSSIPMWVVEANRLREKADQLASLEHAKSEFLRLASHELRAPAAMLGGYLSLIEDESLGAIPERLRPVLPLLRAKAAQINLLANEMVEAARLEDGRLELKRKRVDLRELLLRSLKAAESTATPMHRLRFDDRIGHELWVLGDPMRLEIVIGNLLDNAIKYSPQGGEVLAHLSVSDGLAMLSVRDEGIGIAAEDMSRLFVRFSRLAPYGDVPGTGLGLYLVRELARLHGGDIVAVSTPGKGSEFTLSLPLEPRKK